MIFILPPKGNILSAITYLEARPDYKKWYAFTDPFWRKNIHQNQTRSTYMFNIIYIEKVYVAPSK